MPRLPTVMDMGQRPEPQPARGVAGYSVPDGGGEALGTSIASVGEMITKFAEVEQEKIDSTRTEDAWNQYKNAALDLTAGEKGVLRMKGSDAVNSNMLQTVTDRLGQTRKQLAESLGNDAQRKRFFERANVTDYSVKHQVLGHLAAEHKEYEKIVMSGSESAARATVAATPTDTGVFIGAQGTLDKRADDFLRNQGITDPNAIAAYKDKLNDGLWASRIESLLYSKPLLADAMFRANHAEIKNPELKLQLQAKTREVALSVNSANVAGRIFTEDKAQMTQPRPEQPRPEQSTGGFAPPIKLSSATQAHTQLVQKYASANGVDANVGLAMMQQESQGNMMAASPAGAKGLMQFIDDTAKRFGVDVTKPESSIDGGMRFMAFLLKKFDGDYAKALAGYNMGEGSAEKKNGVTGLVMRHGDNWLDHAPKETQGYVRTILANVGVTYNKAAVTGSGEPTYNTNGMPNSRDMAARLPAMLAKIEAHADELYGPDKNNPDRAAFMRRTTTEMHAKVNEEVQGLNAVQRQAQGTLIDFITGARGGAPGTSVTSFSQIMANPEMARAWQMTDASAKLGLERLLEHNQRAQGKEDKGDVALYRDLWNRIHLEPGDKNKIDFYQQIVDPVIANRLSIEQIGKLRHEIDNYATADGRNVNEMRKGADATVANYFKTHLMFVAQPERQIEATMKWREEAGKKIAEYMKAGKDTRTLFQIETADSIVSPKYLATYLNSTPAQGLSEAAAKVKADEPQGFTPQQIEKLPQVPPTVKTPEAVRAWIQTLPSNVTHVRDGNQPFQISDSMRGGAGRAPAAPAAPPAGAGAGVGGGPGAAASAPAADTADTIPTLDEGTRRPPGYRTDAQKAAFSERMDYIRGNIVSNLPISMLARNVVDAQMAAEKVWKWFTPDEQRRSLESFRSIVKGDSRFRASEDTVAILNNAMLSKDITAKEKIKAQKMLKVVMDKLEAEPQ